MARVVKLSINNLKRLIAEEKAKISNDKLGDPAKVKAKETDADEYGTDKVQEKPVDQAKALKVREARLRKALRLVREQRIRLARRTRRVKR